MIDTTVPRPGCRFTLDPFQLAAINAIDDDRSVLVVAPTGGGKTVIAEHAVLRALGQGQRAAYTAPTKALAGQKRRDLAMLLGEDRVGLITGDRVVQPDADALVMTTEVLRAALSTGGDLADSLGVIVLDELHYIQDPERGSAWEEVILEAPAHVTLVCLSATIASTDVLAGWIRASHGPIELIVETARPVALQHLYAVGDAGGAPPLILPMLVEGELNPTIGLLDGVRRKERGEGLRKRQTLVCTPDRPSLVTELERRSMLPAIWFLLSRAGCDTAAAEMLVDGMRLVSQNEATELRQRGAAIEAGLSVTDAAAVGLPAWLAALEAGIGTHHSGLLPEQREVVEDAFAEGLVRVLFATETLAVGVNLPARTVVVDRVNRGIGGTDTMLTSTQFAQLAGRAGRRGLDDAGFVVVPWRRDVPFSRVASLLEGRLPPLDSKLRPSGAMIANLAASGGRTAALELLGRSLRQHLAERDVAALRYDASARRAAAERARGDAACSCPPDAPAPDGETHAEDDAITTTVASLRMGDVVLDGAKPERPAMVVLNDPRRARGGVAVDAVGPDGRRAVLSTTTCKAAPIVAARIALPDGPTIERGRTRLAVRLLEADGSEAIDRARRLALASHRDSEAPTAAEEQRARHAVHVAAAERSEAEAGAAAVIDAEGDHRLRELADDADAMAGVLEALGFLDRWRPTPRGAPLRRLFHPSGLLVAVALDRGIFAGCRPVELAVLAACCLGRQDRTGPPAPVPRVAVRYGALVRASEELFALEHGAGLPLSPMPDPALAAPVATWCEGQSLAAALDAAPGVLAGDLVRDLRQVAELLGQITESGRSESPVAAAAAAALLRGPVIAADR